MKIIHRSTIKNEEGKPFVINNKDILYWYVF